MAAAYSFVSRWHIPASADACWSEIERMLGTDPGPSWWRGVRVAEPPASIASGEHVALAVRSPLGYRLRVRLTLTEVHAGRSLGADSAGDLRGIGLIF